MFVIGDISVHPSVAETKFACDLERCKGACCTFPGGRGAPLRDEEVAELQRAYPVVEAYLPERHRYTIERNGMVEGSPGNYATQCVEGAACVFVLYDGAVAKCAIEQAFLEGRIGWRKPESCHLFPIRRSRDGKSIHFEYFHECEPALERGRRENIGVHAFSDAPLTRVFGREWTERLRQELTD